MPNAQEKAASNGPKKERKKPVRTAPAQKDYPSKLAWLQAMTEHEQRIADEAAKTKVARLDKRIAAKREALAKAQADLDKLVAERAELVPVEDEAGTPES